MLHCRNSSKVPYLLVVHLSIGLWNCSDSVTLFGFLLDFGTVLTVWHYLFFYWTLELNSSENCRNSFKFPYKN
jgi:hypothetical protein